jgi:hypothetical protein
MRPALLVLAARHCGRRATRRGDLRLYAERRLAALPTARHQALAERIARAAAGNSLYAPDVVDELLTQPERLRNPGASGSPAVSTSTHKYLTAS